MYLKHILDDDDKKVVNLEATTKEGGVSANSSYTIYGDSSNYAWIVANSNV